MPSAHSGDTGAAGWRALMLLRGGGVAVLGAMLACLAGAVAQAPQAASAQITYERDWPEQAVPFYHFLVHADGSGVFTTDRAAAGVRTATAAGSPVALSEGTTATVAVQPATAVADAAAPAGGVGDTAIHLSEKTTAHLFAEAGALRSSKGCQVGNRHLAQTGRKVLTLEDGAGVQSCTFNYSEDKRIEEAVAVFGAIATTLQERAVLEHLRRYDRLGLDAELGSFLESAKAGRAIELANIAPLLEKLAADEALMDRVRSRATTLLTMAQAGS